MTYESHPEYRSMFEKTRDIDKHRAFVRENAENITNPEIRRHVLIGILEDFVILKEQQIKASERDIPSMQGESEYTRELRKDLLAVQNLINYYRNPPQPNIVSSIERDSREPNSEMPSDIKHAA